MPAQDSTATLPPPAADVGLTHAAQLRHWLTAGEAVLIDVREPDEHARERIEGARPLPLSRFSAAEAGALAGAARHVVFQCKSGRRSADACRLAASIAADGRVVLSLDGGIEAWKAAGLPVRADAGAPALSVMRQVQLTIGAGVLLGCTLGWLVHPALSGLAAFFGAGLLFAGATGTCGLATLLAKMPWNAGACASSCGTRLNR